MSIKKGALIAAAAVSVALLSSCSGQEAPTITRTEHDTAKAYVAALNARDVDALTRLAPAGYEGTETEAQDIIATHGGRDLKISDVRVSHDFEKDLASIYVSATDSKSRSISKYIQMSLEKDKWVIILGHAPGVDDGEKSSSPTDR
ncbi:hypothetical protein [Streptomyces sp. AS58]|uniref:hypothetical protein n=1 Tax=Streptomyces sp. AS58 TaxID=1519489 RepID=UPI0006AE626C|nr:hypothetical protein [Streptomyces sp. AS58]